MKSTTIIVTFIVIPLIILAILLYDVYAIYVGGTEASISSVIITASYKMPFLVFCISFPTGVLFGHLFWRMRGNGDTKEIDKDS